MKQFDTDNEDIPLLDNHKPTYIKEQHNNNCQQFFGPITNCTFTMPAPNTHTPSTQKSTKQGGRSKKKDINKVRELMTFNKKTIVDGHITILFMKLQKAGWIDGTEEDFKDLFKGENKDCSLTWKKKFGKSTLVYLFQQMIDNKCIELKTGFTLPNVLSGHFKDEEGYWLTGLDKGDKPAPKAVSFVDECVKLLLTSYENLDYNDLKDLFEDLEGNYDKFDRQDMHLHRR